MQHSSSHILSCEQPEDDKLPSLRLLLCSPCQFWSIKQTMMAAVQMLCHPSQDLVAYSTPYSAQACLFS
jgi:hypothetical protein